MSDGRDLSRAAKILVAIELRIREERTDGADGESIDGDDCVRSGID
jgi:hypothetical protein